MPCIIPIKELKDTSKISTLCHEQDEPIYVTKNGYGDMVIMSISYYENMLERLNLYNSLALSEDQIRRGEVVDARKSLSAIKDKYGLSDNNN